MRWALIDRDFTPVNNLSMLCCNFHNKSMHHTLRRAENKIKSGLKRTHPIGKVIVMVVPFPIFD